MKAKRVKKYTQEEVDLMISEAVKQDREFCSLVLRSLPVGDKETKQAWIENPKALKAHLIYKGIGPVRGMVYISKLQ